MKNFTLFLLGLVLTYVPTCLSQMNIIRCYSELLKPSYPCCKNDTIVYADKIGDWGVEDGKWCGIGNGFSKKLDNFCFSILLGYHCCQSCEIVVTDKDGNWGIENGKWCGIKDSCIPSENETKNPMRDDTNFDFAFLKMENRKENMVYSPLSIKYALKMLEEGAVNNTFSEINQAIGNIELPKYTSIDERLSIANGIFIKDIYFENVNTEYINTLKEKYDAEIQKDEFENAQNVNQWVSDKTFGIIRDIIKDELVKNPSHALILISALAIDGKWAVPFKVYDTMPDQFYTDDGEKIKVTMMIKKETSGSNLSYYMDDNVTAITMDLNDDITPKIEFMAIMPNENLSEFIKNLTKEQIQHIDRYLTTVEEGKKDIVLNIPRFEFEYGLMLKKDLMGLGINGIFDEQKADLSRMVNRDVNNGNNFYIADTIHKAKIEFTENGVKAAAVTSTQGFFALSGPPFSPEAIIFNKPFMFIIRDKEAKNIWFTGTVYKPNLWEK